jgi:hypothetical protein
MFASHVDTAFASSNGSGFVGSLVCNGCDVDGESGHVVNIGFLAESGSGLGARICNVIGRGGKFVNDAFVTSGSNSAMTVFNGVIANCDKGLVTSEESTITAATLLLNFNNTGSVLEGADQGAQQNLSSVTFLNSADNDIAINQSSSFVDLNSCILRDDKITFVTGSGIRGIYVNSRTDERSVDVVSELHVGTPERPSEATFGEGDSYVRGVLLYQSGSGGISENKAVSASLAGDGLTLPIFGSTTAGEQIYIASDRLNKNANKVKHEGFKYTLNTFPSGGAILSYFWDGTDWTQFNYMVTEAGGDYLPAGREFFVSGSGAVDDTYHLRYDEDLDISGSWVSRTIGTGEASEPVRFWTKFEIITDLITNPVIDQLKLHSNRTELNEDGFIEFFGDSRPRGSLPWHTSQLAPAATAVGNMDIWWSDNLDVGMLENNLNSNGDRVTFHSSMPPDFDTSTPVKFRFAVRPDGVSGTFSYTIRWTWAEPGSGVHDDAAGAPTTHPNEQSLAGSVTITDDQVNWIEESLDFPDAIAVRKNGFGDILVVGIERTAAPASTGIIVVDGRYTKWCNGEHVVVI